MRSWLRIKHSAGWVIGFLLSAQCVQACPWCKNSPLQEPTVTPEMGDAGGTFFGKPPPPEKSRRYYIAAEPVQWSFFPKGIDPMSRAPIPDRFRENSMKLRYVQYTDETFRVRADQPAHLGILGPVLRGQPGEFILVTFLNRTDRPLSMHPHGVKYDKDSEGASYFPERGLGAAVAPQARHTYVWQVDSSAAPRASEPSSKAWLYHSHVLADQEINLGLFGFIVVTDPARARPDGTPVDVDREMATAFIVFDETPPEDEDLFALPLPAEASQRTNFLQQRMVETVSELQKRELNARHSVNGRIFGNLDGLEMLEGERVRWYLFALGSERDLHTAHWHGTRVAFNGRMTDVVELLPGSMAAVDFAADNPGNWLFHCHVADHMMEGMYASFTVYSRNATNRLSPQVQNKLYSAQIPPEALRVEKAESEMKEGQEILHLTATFHLVNPPPLNELPVQLHLEQSKWSFSLDQAGRGTNNAASIQLALHRAGGALGVEMRVDFRLRNPPAFPSRNIPVRLSLDEILVKGTAQLR